MNLPDRVFFADRMKFIENELVKTCVQHHREAKYFCAKLNCVSSAYLCETCRKENSHQHTDELYAFQQFIGKLVSLIEESNSADIFSSKRIGMDHQESYQAIFTEKCRNLEELDILRAKINSLIDESRVRIANDIGRYQKSITNRLTAKTYLYMNPYILINKLNTEATEEFLQELKSALFKGSPVDFKDNFDPKIEIATLAARIRDFLSTIGNHEKNTDRGFIRTQTKEPKISLSFDNFVKNEVEPNTIHSNQAYFLLCGQKQTLLYSTFNRKLQLRLPVTISRSIAKCSFVCNGKQLTNNNAFFAINRDNSKQLQYFLNGKVNKASFNYKMASVCCLDINGRYVALGSDDGIIAIYDAEKQRQLLDFQGPPSLVQHMVYYIAGKRLFCLLYPNQIVSYRITLNNEAAIIDLPEMLDFKVADVQMIKLFDSVFVLLSSNRNIMVYDLMLKYTIYRSNYNTRSPAFDRCSLAETADKLLLLTHNEDQGSIYTWSIDKQNPKLMSCEKKMIFERSDDMKALQIINRQIWAAKQGEDNLYVYNVIVI